MKGVAGQQRVSEDYISDYPTPLPSYNEQQEITEYLQRWTKAFEQIKAQTIKAMTSLEEYRTALISAAVTGKIDVREWEADR